MLKTQKQIDEESKKELHFLETIMIAHDFYKHKLEKADKDGLYKKYQKRLDENHILADIIDNDIVKLFIKNKTFSDTSYLKPSFIAACIGSVSIGVGLGLQLFYPGHPLSAIIAGGALEVVSIPTIVNFYLKQRKHFKLKMDFLDSNLRWVVLKYIPAYTEGFMRVNNLAKTNVFDIEEFNNVKYMGDRLENLRDPLKEDEKTKEEFRKFLKISKLDKQCEII